MGKTMRYYGRPSVPWSQTTRADHHSKPGMLRMTSKQQNASRNLAKTESFSQNSYCHPYSHPNRRRFANDVSTTLHGPTRTRLRRVLFLLPCQLIRQQHISRHSRKVAQTRGAQLEAVVTKRRPLPGRSPKCRASSWVVCLAISTRRGDSWGTGPSVCKAARPSLLRNTPDPASQVNASFTPRGAQSNPGPSGQRNRVSPRIKLRHWRGYPSQSRPSR